MSGTVDVAINVFGKPYQTLLCLASLLRHCGPDLGRVFFIMEKRHPALDAGDLACLRHFHEKIVFFAPEYWLGLDVLDLTRLHDKAYRHSLRYQYAWESTRASYLALLHNDVYIRGNFFPGMVEGMGDAIACGRVGQCWVCPAGREACARSVVGDAPCSPGRYTEFRPDYKQLKALYQCAAGRGMKLRPAWASWPEEFRDAPWPLPECRVNEWCCLIHMDKARRVTVPLGRARPFGAYLSGTDLGVAWFRDVHRAGHHVVDVPLSPYFTHWGGHTALFHEDLYRRQEARAAALLAEEYPEALAWARGVAPHLFAEPAADRTKG